MVSSTQVANAAEYVVAVLREEILTGKLNGGAPVREHDLAQRLGVSRTPVREAVGRLVAEGLLMKDGNRTAHVFRPSLEELLEVYEIRIPLESLAARLSCEAADEQLVAELTMRAKELDNAEPGIDWSIKHEEFHVCVARGSGRQRLVGLVRTLRVQSEPYVRIAVSSDSRIRRRAQHDHADIVRLVAEGNGKGLERLVRDHLSATRNDVAALLDRHQDEQRTGAFASPNFSLTARSPKS